MARFVAQRGVDVQELQEALDQLVEQARQAAEPRKKGILRQLANWFGK